MPRCVLQAATSRLSVTTFLCLHVDGCLWAEARLHVTGSGLRLLGQRADLPVRLACMLAVPRALFVCELYLRRRVSKDVVSLTLS